MSAAAKLDPSPKVALIPGGARGIGRAIALSLADDGWSVAIAYRHSESKAAELTRQVEARGARALALRCDISQREACESLVAQTERHLGPIRALIHAAGPYRRIPLLEENSEDWRALFDANLHAFFDLAQLTSVGMRRASHGRLLSFGLAGAEQLPARPNIAAHSIAKAALIALTRNFAEVLGPYGITANTISPGFIDSGNELSKQWREMAKTIPAHRLGTLEDIVSAARFLLSDQAAYINGANLLVSGGWGV